MDGRIAGAQTHHHGVQIVFGSRHRFRLGARWPRRAGIPIPTDFMTTGGFRMGHRRRWCETEAQPRRTLHQRRPTLSSRSCLSQSRRLPQTIFGALGKTKLTPPMRLTPYGATWRQGPRDSERSRWVTAPASTVGSRYGEGAVDGTELAELTLDPAGSAIGRVVPTAEMSIRTEEFGTFKVNCETYRPLTV